MTCTCGKEEKQPFRFNDDPVIAKMERMILHTAGQVRELSGREALDVLPIKAKVENGDASILIVQKRDSLQTLFHIEYRYLFDGSMMNLIALDREGLGSTELTPFVDEEIGDYTATEEGARLDSAVQKILSAIREV